MSVRREDTASKPDELQIGSSWIPATPAKATLTPICTNWGENQTEQANCLEGERSASTTQAAQSSVLGSEEFVQHTQSQIDPSYYASMGVNNASTVANWHASMTNSQVYKDNLIAFESWAAGDAANSHLFGKGSSTYDNLSTTMNDPDQWSNVSFGSLMKVIGENAEKGNALKQSNFATSSSAFFHPQFEHSLLEPLDRSGVSTSSFHPGVERRQFTMSSGSTSMQHTMLGANFDAEWRIANTVTGKFTI